MLRLQLQIKEKRLRVREERGNFTSSFTWRNQVEFEMCPTGNFMMAWTSLLPDLPPYQARALLDLQSARYPVSPHYFELKALCPELVFSDADEEWVFFGGSFNPWHKGHQACINLLPIEKTCFILPDINPFKEPAEIELVPKVLEISARARFKPNQFLVPTFLMQSEKNPTVNWIERLASEFPGKRLSLLVGFDSFESITTWTRAKELLPLLHKLYVASRLEDEIKRTSALEKVRGISPNLEIDFLGRHDFEGVSSTQLRKK